MLVGGMQKKKKEKLKEVTQAITVKSYAEAVKSGMNERKIKMGK